MIRSIAATAATISACTQLLVACGDHVDGPPGGMGGVPVGAMGPAAGGSVGGSGGFGAGALGTGGALTCTGTSSPGASGAIAPTFDTVKLVLQGGGPIMPCFAAPCHGLGGMAPPGRPLALPPNDDQTLYTNLTTYVSTACGNLTLVSPCDPEHSALPKILSGPCGMTPRMPYGCSAQDGNCIPDEYISAIVQWIANGALR